MSGLENNDLQKSSKLNSDSRDVAAGGFDRKGAADRFLLGSGIEIGGLQRPLMVGKNAQVKYVDRMPVSELRRHYPELASVPLVEVDIIDDGERLAAIKDLSQDFVIANHFIEHCQNPILAFTNMLRVLKNGGVIYLAIPDKRFTFDRHRPDTPIDHLVKDYEQGPEWSKSQHYIEWSRYVNHLREDVEILARAQQLMRMDYSIHFHVWSQASMWQFFWMLGRMMPEKFEIEVCLKYQEEVIWIMRKFNSFLPDINKLPRLAEPALYSIDSINDRVFLPSENSAFLLNNGQQTVIIKGWALDKLSNSLAGGVIVELDGKEYRAQYGIEREDVAIAFSLPACRNAGFECEILEAGIMPGEHVLRLKVLTNDQKSYYVSRELSLKSNGVLQQIFSISD